VTSMRSFCVLTVIVLMSPAFAQAVDSVPSADGQWKRISDAIDAYAKSPSNETAQVAIDIIPGQPVAFTNSPEETRANDIIYSERVMTVLKARIRIKDQESVRLAFKLMNIADGAFAEDLETYLGQLIPIDPSLFLSELKHSNRTDIDGLVGNLGDSFSDHFREQCSELNRRRRALRAVSDLDLQSAKDRADSATSRVMASIPGCKSR
jgi:hypothetical protein